jgi:hypothetical protein
MVPLVFELALLLLELVDVLAVVETGAAVTFDDTVGVAVELAALKLPLDGQAGIPATAGRVLDTQAPPLQLHHMQCTFSW